LRDLAPHTTLNCLAPGYYNTHLNIKALGTQEGRDRAGEKMPLKRVGEPQDAAGIALTLCSDAGSYITGQTIYVDGGMSAKWW
jgi:glucose 1-dehydrogenase